MKPITLFGRKISIKVEESKKVEELVRGTESKDKVVANRLALLAIILSFFVISSKLTYVKDTYKLGQVVGKDIISPNSITYVDKERKRELIAKLLSQEEGIYIRNKKIEQDVYIKISNFFTQIKQMQSQGEYPNIIDNEEFQLTEEEKSMFTDPEETRKLQETVNRMLQELFDEGLRNIDTEVKEAKSNLKNRENSLAGKVVAYYLLPNELYSYEETERELKKKIANIDDVEVVINTGDIIIKKGQELKVEDIELLKKVGVYSATDNFRIVIGNILFLAVVSTLFIISLKKVLIKEMERKQQFLGTLLAITLYMAVLRFTNLKYLNIFPFESISLMLGILFGVPYATILSSFLAMYIIAMVGYNYITFVVVIVSMAFAIYSVKKVKNRTDIINTGIYIGLVKLLTGVAIGWVAKLDFVNQVFGMVELFLSGLLSAMVVIALLPYFENTFNILTKMKLIELGDLSHPLLRKMSLEAPGTFHHSMLVATLSEQAAEAIGADPIFTRVACYYHDIGKMKRPNFYVENQRSGVNPHDTLSPTLSTIIIKAHTKDGQEMGKEYRIPKEIRDVMAEHQGTTFLAYFYNKAKKENPDILETDYRYDGPKPRSKESAVIMMADSIEAAVRSLDEKDPVSVEKMIRKIISAKMDDDQFSEADITLKEIETIIKTFVKTLQGIYHSRIKYPDQKK